MKYVVDSWAWIEYLISSPRGEEVKKVIESDENVLYINSVILAEVVSKTARENMDAKTSFDALTVLSTIADVNDPEFSREVGVLHAEMRKKIKDFGLSDAFVLATAKRLNAKVLTGDPHFKNMKEAVMI